MKNEITDEKLIALITGDQDEELIQEIARNPNLKKRFDEMTEVLQVMEQNQEAEVPVHIGANFEQAIWNEQNRKSFTFGSWQAAAAVVFIVAGFLLGRFTGQGGETVQNSELTSLKHEIQLLKEVTMASTLKQHSASERMMAVNQIEKSQTVNPVLVKTLINTFNTDDSPNVRYEALQALIKFLGDANVRSSLVKSLEYQVDPLIQISLINVLMNAEEQSAIAPLKELITNDVTTPEVKKQAEIALQVLI